MKLENIHNSLIFKQKTLVAGLIQTPAEIHNSTFNTILRRHSMTLRNNLQQNVQRIRLQLKHCKTS